MSAESCWLYFAPAPRRVEDAVMAAASQDVLPFPSASIRKLKKNDPRQAQLVTVAYRGIAQCPDRPSYTQMYTDLAKIMKRIAYNAAA